MGTIHKTVRLAKKSRGKWTMVQNTCPKCVTMQTSFESNIDIIPTLKVGSSKLRICDDKSNSSSEYTRPYTSTISRPSSPKVVGRPVIDIYTDLDLYTGDNEEQSIQSRQSNALNKTHSLSSDASKSIRKKTGSTESTRRGSVGSLTC